MNNQTGTQAPAQAGIEDFNGIFQERVRDFVLESLLSIFEQEVTSPCGETYRPSKSVHRRAGSEMVTIQTISGKKRISKRRFREMLAQCSSDAQCEVYEHQSHRECDAQISRDDRQGVSHCAKQNDTGKMMRISMIKTMECLCNLRGEARLLEHRSCPADFCAMSFDYPGGRASQPP
jgi:hypothetical protein